MHTKTKRILYILGGGTAILGIAACGAYRYHHDPEQRAQWMMKKVSKKLDLNADQQVKLETVRDQLVATVKIARAGRDSVHEEALDLIKGDKLDKEKAIEMVNKRTDTVKEHAPTIIAAIGDFYDSLNEDQRAKLRERITEHMEHHRH